MIQKPQVGSYNQEDVCRQKAHVVKLRDMPEGVLVLSGLSRVWKSQTRDSVIKGSDGNGTREVMGIHDFLCLPEWTEAKVQEELHHDINLAVGAPSAKVMDKVKSSKKRKALLSGAALSHVAKRTRSAVAQSFGSTTQPKLFATDFDEESNDDEDACVEIPLITPIRSTIVIPTEGNQSEGSALPAAEGPSIRDSRGKDIMTDAVDPSSRGASCYQSFTAHVPYFRDLFGDAIHKDFFPFSPGPYYATYPKGGVAGSFFKRGALPLDVYSLKVLVFRSRLLVLMASILPPMLPLLRPRRRGKKKEEIKSFTKNLDHLNAEVARLSSTLNQATILEAKKGMLRSNS
nr:hypothetical protein [Tanacetum cinerariifolium]